MNLFATVLTKKQPCANYRGESELNRAVIQKVTDGRFDYPIFSPESMRNALRDTLRGYGLPSNRERLQDEEQLAVKFADYLDPEQYSDDFFFGYLVAASGKDRKEIEKILAEKRGKTHKFAFKRDSVLRMNLARALEPYRNNAIFTQSPQDLTPKDVKKFSNDSKSNLLHRETVVSAFQFPFALSLTDCKAKPDWTRKLLQAIGELNDVAGNHARSYGPNGPLHADFHSLRHSFVALLDRAGASLKEAMQLARHSNPKLTMKRYGRANLSDLAVVVARLPDFVGPPKVQSPQDPANGSAIASATVLPSTRRARAVPKSVISHAPLLMTHDETPTATSLESTCVFPANSQEFGTDEEACGEVREVCPAGVEPATFGFGGRQFNANFLGIVGVLG